MQILVTGAKGQLGHDVTKELRLMGHKAIGFGSLDMDITDKTSCSRRINALHPDAVIHCAAWTDVDSAERSSNRDKVYAVNVLGTRYIAEACKNICCKLLYISTDYVFDGSGDGPWIEGSPKGPLNYYGETKLQGEDVVTELLDQAFIVRTAWLYGLAGNNFIKAILRKGRKQETISVVDDQIGTPTSTADLARLLVKMVETEKYGIYHAVNEGNYVSRYDLAQMVFDYMHVQSEIIPIKTSEISVGKAARPLNSRMSTEGLAKFGFARLPDWQSSLKRFLDELNSTDALI